MGRYNGWFASAGVVTAMVVCTWVTVASQAPTSPNVVAAQASSAGAKFTAPRTPWGDPDLQGEGIWTIAHFGRSVDMERPPELAGRVELTQEEADARADRVANYVANEQGGTGTYGREWRDIDVLLPKINVRYSRRTSTIIDPPDGLIPYRPEARKRMAAEREVAGRPRPVQGVEDLGEAGRCLPNVYMGRLEAGGVDNGMRIVQSPGFVVMLYENGPPHMRVIPIAADPPSTIPQFWGQPRGRWEGDTLVVETTHYKDRKDLRLVERFTRTAVNEFDYKATIEDPTTYSRPWTVGMNWLHYPGIFELVEYACHEGNYSLPTILRIAQMETEKKGTWTPVRNPPQPTRLQVAPKASTGGAAAK